ncbi:hypothetical protein [Saccharothrix sp. ALI-22-I]|nr:hypothetical protein [Saccharothrix sp. ALI-22-I]
MGVAASPIGTDYWSINSVATDRRSIDSVGTDYWSINRADEIPVVRSV